MGGVPRSRGCSTCKARKIKCDETWPSCIQCRSQGAVCPGPTTLVKFVNAKSHAGGALTLNFRPATANKPWKFAADTQDVRSKKVQYSKVEDSTAEYGLLFFGKPKSMPTTLAERVAMRLTTKMQEAADHGITSIHMSYLIYTPKRLVESTCLRDAVDCFCSAWTDYQSREPQGEIIALPQYGKALRSLRRALLNPDEALKTETLAAITIMGRACTLFDREHTVSIHVKGIVQLITSKGPPDINDDLDVAVCNEAHATLMPVWVYGKSVEFLTRSPWKESLDACAILHSRVQSKDWKFLSLKDAITLYGYAKGLSEDRKRFQGLYLAPVSDETKAAAASHRDHLRRVKKHIKELTARSLIMGKNSGEITESPNPGGLTESRYGFCSTLLAQTFQAMVTGQITILHMLIGLNTVHEDDQDVAAELKASYREASLEYWKFLPYLHELDTIVAWHFLPSVCLTWEATETDEEREAVLKMVAYMDSYLERWSKDPIEVQYAMVETAKLLTGRREDLAIL